MKRAGFLAHRRWSQLATGVTVSLVTFAYAFPLWYALNNALKKGNFIMSEPLFLRPATFTLSNLANVFRIMQYPRHFLNTSIILVLTCTLLVSLGALAGFGIALARSRWLNRLYYFLVATLAFPFALAMIPLIIQMKSMGLLNNYLGTSLAHVGHGLPFVIFLYTGFMRTIPKELEDSARCDGCSLFGTFWRIYMPLLKQITGTVLIIRGIGVWNDLIIAMITISKPRMLTLPYRLMSFVGFRFVDWHMVFAGTFLVSLPVMLMFMALQRYFTQGVLSGALRG